jgi:hypothetical protein
MDKVNDGKVEVFCRGENLGDKRVLASDWPGWQSDIDKILTSASGIENSATAFRAELTML